MAGGLRYHGMAPLISHVYEQGFMEAISIPQIECFQGGSWLIAIPQLVLINNFTFHICIGLEYQRSGLNFLQVLFSLQEQKG